MNAAAQDHSEQGEPRAANTVNMNWIYHAMGLMRELYDTAFEQGRRVTYMYTA